MRGGAYAAPDPRHLTHDIGRGFAAPGGVVATDHRLHGSSLASDLGGRWAAASEHQDAGSAAGGRHYSQIVGLRDRLVREAMADRQRFDGGIGTADELDKPRLGGCGSAAVPSTSGTTAASVYAERGALGSSLLEGSAALPATSSPSAVTSSAGSARTAPLGAPAVPSPALSCAGRSAGAGAAWTAEDEAMQQEALRTISLLANRSGAGDPPGRVAELEGHLGAERAHSQELEAVAAEERRWKEAVQEQVRCLEYELDSKEAALQVAEKALERRDADLQQAQMQLRAFQEGNFSMTSGYGGGASADDARFAALKAQVKNCDQQLEMKDQHISRLLGVLKQHQHRYTEDDRCWRGLRPDDGAAGA